MGVGLYLVWPAFYCDVTEAYRLNRARPPAHRPRRRLLQRRSSRCWPAPAYFATGSEALLLAAFVQHMIVLQQLLPLLRFDGYYVLSDLTGVPDILSRIKPIFRSLVRAAATEPRVDRAQAVGPRRRHGLPDRPGAGAGVPARLDGDGRAADRSRPPTTRSGSSSTGSSSASGAGRDRRSAPFRIASLVLPVGAMSLSVGRSSAHGGRGSMRWSRGSVARRLVASALIVATVAAWRRCGGPTATTSRSGPASAARIGEAVRSVPQPRQRAAVVHRGAGADLRTRPDRSRAGVARSGAHGARRGGARPPRGRGPAAAPRG